MLTFLPWWLDVEVDTTVYLSPEEILGGLDDEGRAALARSISPNFDMAVPTGTSQTIDALVERAFCDIRHRADVPASVKDLFWHGFGRAMA